MNNYDVIIVGGGVIGKSIAFRLMGTKLRILCVDSSTKAAGSASLAAGAMLGAFGEVTQDKVSPLDKYELEFRVKSSRLYPGWLDEIRNVSGNQIYSKLGTFVIANPRGKSDRFNLKKIEEALISFDEKYEWVEPTDIPGFHPNPDLAAYQALYIANEGCLSTFELMDGLSVALKKAENISLIDGEVSGLISNDAEVSGVVLSNGQKYVAQNVILCAGVGIESILNNPGGNRFGIPILLAGKGVSLVLDTDKELEHVIRTPNRDFACGTHVVPRTPKTVYVGATNRIAYTPGAAGGITSGELHNLLHSAMHEINTSFRSSNATDIRYGLRPITVDRFPIVGKTEKKGLIIATGTYRNGILMSPLIATLVFNEITGLDSEFENLFSPLKRNLHIKTSTVSEILEGGVNDLVSFVQEPTGSLPYNRAEELKDFIFALMKNSFSDDEVFKQLTTETRRLMDQIPLTEIVPQIYYKYHDAVQKMKSEKAGR